MVRQEPTAAPKLGHNAHLCNCGERRREVRANAWRLSGQGQARRPQRSPETENRSASLVVLYFLLKAGTRVTLAGSARTHTAGHTRAVEIVNQSISCGLLFGPAISVVRMVPKSPAQCTNRGQGIRVPHRCSLLSARNSHAPGESRLLSIVADRHVVFVITPLRISVRSCQTSLLIVVGA